MPVFYLWFTSPIAVLKLTNVVQEILKREARHLLCKFGEAQGLNILAMNIHERTDDLIIGKVHLYYFKTKQQCGILAIFRTFYQSHFHRKIEKYGFLDNFRALLDFLNASTE